jgi:hypothetical protein
MQYCTKSKENYCKKHINCDLIIKTEKHPSLINTGASWSKLAYVSDLIKKNKYDYIFMCDADVIFMNYDFSIIDMIKKRFDLSKKIVISSEINHIEQENFDEINEVHQQIFQDDIICAGNMFFKNDDWNIKFIENLLSVDHSKYAPLCEQTPLNEMYKKYIDIHSNIQTINNQHLFNSFYTYCYRSWIYGDFLCHIANWNKYHLKAISSSLYKLSNSNQVDLSNKLLNSLFLIDNELNKFIHLKEYLRYDIYQFKNKIETTTININELSEGLIVDKGEWFRHNQNNLFILSDKSSKYLLWNLLKIT